MKPKVNKDMFQFPNGTHLAFTTGAFDDWKCDLLDPYGNAIESLTDTQLFTWLLDVVDKEGRETVWGLVRQLAFASDYSVDEVGHAIRRVMISNGIYVSEFDYVRWAYLGMAMFAEEQKANAPVGKFMKLLGIRQVMDGMMPATAANWSKGQRWQAILAAVDKSVPDFRHMGGKLNKKLDKEIR